jgi:hypothetical protein
MLPPSSGLIHVHYRNKEAARFADVTSNFSLARQINGKTLLSMTRVKLPFISSKDASPRELSDSRIKLILTKCMIVAVCSQSL